MDIYARRRARLALLVEQKAHGNVAEFARSYGYSRSQISQFLSDTYNSGRSIGERAARGIEEKVGSPSGWLDLQLSDDEESRLKFPFSTAELRVATSQTQPIDSSPYAPYLARIPIVAEVTSYSEANIEKLALTEPDKVRFLEYYSLDALQAARVKGWGLAPRVKNGEFIVINNALVPQPGDDVIMTIKGKGIVVAQYLFERDGERACRPLDDSGPTVIVSIEDIETFEPIIAILHRGTRTFEEET